MSPIELIILCLINSLLAAVGSSLLKFSSSKLELSLSHFISNKIFWSACAIYGLGVICGVLALKEGDLSFVYPIISLSYIWSFISGIIFFEEQINKLKLSGIIFIFLGVSIVGLTG